MNTSDKRNLYETTLLGAGYRMTEQRKLICDHLAGLQTHPTAYEIYDSLLRRHPEISRATVYNTLNTLKELGAIVEISFAGDHSRYETDTTPHINLICLRCHRVIDYEHVEQTSSLMNEVQTGVDFQPLTVRVELLGFCSDCRHQRRDEIRQQWIEQHEPKGMSNDDSNFFELR